MFRVSRRVDYGLKLLVALAAEQEEGAQATSRLAEKLNIPLAFLHQIGRSLIQAGMVRSTPGPGGGLRLNQPAEKISLLQILEVLDGPVRLSTCLEQPDECANDPFCPSHQVWNGVQEKLIDELRSILLSSLAEQMVNANSKGFYALKELNANSNVVMAN